MKVLFYICCELFLKTKRIVIAVRYSILKQRTELQMLGGKERQGKSAGLPCKAQKVGFKIPVRPSIHLQMKLLI